VNLAVAPVIREVQDVVGSAFKHTLTPNSIWDGIVVISPRVVTKIVQPSRSRLLLSRPRLIEFLNQHIERKLLLISASPGYGKTSLLIDFVHETSMPICWYSLDASDSDPLVFLDYLVAAINRRFPRVGEQSRSILENCRTVTLDKGPFTCVMEAVVGTMVTEIQDNISDSFIIVLDDYHSIAESDVINRLVETLIAYLPEKAHLIISSRAKPEKLNLTRLAAHNQIAALGVQELQFTAEEIQALVLQSHQVELSAEETRELATRSEGWVAGILLTTPQLWRGLYQRLLQRRDADNVELYRFLATEAFMHIDPEQQRFLLDCAVLFRMDAQICNELLGIHHAGELLRTLEDQNLFMLELGGESGGSYYRFHNLYHDFLRYRLKETDPTRWLDLNRRAAELYDKTDSFKGQAIAHYLAAGLPEDAARLIEQIAQSTFDSGQWTTLADWIDALSAEVLDAHPDLVVMRGMVHAETGENAESQAAYAKAIAIFHERGDELAAAKVVVWRAMLWRQIGSYREAIDACSSVLEPLHSQDARVEEARAYRTIGAAYAYLGEYPSSINEQEKALKLYQELGDDLRVAWLHHDMGASLRFLGDHRAEDHFSRALDYWQQTHNVVGLSTTLNSIGVGHHQEGNYAEALEVLEAARELAHQIAHRRNEAYALASLGDVYRDQGEYAHALELYRQVLDIAEQLNGFILTYALNAVGESYSLLDDANAACDYLARAMKVALAHRSNYEIGLVETTLGICVTRSGSVVDAIKHLSRAVKLLNTMKRDRVRARLHLAQAYFLNRQSDRARSQLETIVEENPALVVTAIPFIFADQKYLQPLIQFAVAKRIGDDYYAPVLGQLREPGCHPEGVPQVPRLIVQARAFGHAQVYVGAEKEMVTTWKTDLVKQLFFLVLARPDGLSTEEIIELLWVDKQTSDPVNTFHTTKARLRKAIPNCIEKDQGVYVLAQDIELHYDVGEFETLIQSARSAKTDGERLQAYERAIQLYQGDYFEDCYNDWCQELRVRLRKTYLDAILATAEIKERQGDLQSTRDLYQQYLQKDRDCEQIYRALMRLQARMGDRVGAVKTYQQCVQVLQKDLEILEPSPETVELYTQIVKGETAFALAD